MHGYKKRTIEQDIIKKLANNPVVTLLGPRQCGKSTLAKHMIGQREKSIYLDLEKNSDLRKLDQPELFFERYKGYLICLDEIQRKPELFPAIRSFVDEGNKNGQFLILGSASIELLKQTSETLAGRIAFLELTPFAIKEVYPRDNDSIWKLWQKGGFPRSFLEKDEQVSYEWRENFIRTFLERDVIQFGFKDRTNQMESFWRMLAHFHGQIFNSSKIGQSLGVSYHTARSYLRIFEKTFLVRVLQPYEVNLKKRLIKSNKVYIRDTGLLHTLLEIESTKMLLGHPSFGASWEGFVIENIINVLPRWRAYFYRTRQGAEVDLILEKGLIKIAIECKASEAPKVSRSFRESIKLLCIDHAWVVAPVKEGYPIESNIDVVNLSQFIEDIKNNKLFD